MTDETKTPLTLTVQRIEISGTVNGQRTRVPLTGFVLGPIGLHPSTHWDNRFALTLLSNGRAIMDGLQLNNALLAIEQLQGLAWIEPFIEEAKAVQALWVQFAAANAKDGEE